MTQELTISRYKENTGVGYEVMLTIFFFLVFSGLTLLGIWIFKFSDKTTPTKTEKKKNDKYMKELGVTGVVITYLSLSILFFIIYYRHSMEDDME